MSSPPRAAGIPPHGYGLLVVNHIVKVGKGARKFPSVDGLGRLTGVLKGDTKVGTAGSSGFAWLDLCGCVADLGEMV